MGTPPPCFYHRQHMPPVSFILYHNLFLRLCPSLCVLGAQALFLIHPFILVFSREPGPYRHLIHIWWRIREMCPFVQCQVFHFLNFFSPLFLIFAEHLITENGGFLEISGGSKVLSLTQGTRTAYCGGVILKKPGLLEARLCILAWRAVVKAPYWKGCEEVCKTAWVAMSVTDAEDASHHQIPPGPSWVPNSV